MTSVDDAVDVSKRPYHYAAPIYFEQGWEPIPVERKYPPVAGFTGRTGAEVTLREVHGWGEGPEGARNIALRLPDSIIGIDIDQYDQKHGEETLEAAEVELGHLPESWKSTSRGMHQPAGIYLYRVPMGLDWGKAEGRIRERFGPDVDIIRREHRYVMVAPSRHPEVGPYEWFDDQGYPQSWAYVPRPVELPELPASWVEFLTRGEPAQERASSSSRANPPDDSTGPDPEWFEILEGWTWQYRHAGLDYWTRPGKAPREGWSATTGPRANGADLFYNFSTSVELPEGKGLGKETVRRLLAGGDELLPGEGVEIMESNGNAPPITDDWRARLLAGGPFLLDAPREVPAVWGKGSQVAWSEGEPCILAGPSGVGKTTLAGQLVMGRLGLLEVVLGLPVAPGMRKVLYLACDRPAQVQRALARLVSEADRDLLDKRLVVWKGPPPGDLAQRPRLLLEMCQAADADTVVLDSLKDVAVGLSEDKPGAGINSAHQLAVGAGIEVLSLHHQRKANADNRKPSKLDDLYGSTWIAAGAGSVLLLWGEAGDPVVELSHLKQPAEPIGPWTVVHDHDAGTSELAEVFDVLAYLRLAGGATAADVARQMFGLTKAPSANQTEKARRKLERLVAEGHARREGGGKGTGNVARYYATEGGQVVG